MKESQLGRVNTAQKTHYKMYKAGKQWLFAGLTLLFFGVAEGFTTQTAAADTGTDQITLTDDSMAATSSVASQGSVVLSSTSAASEPATDNKQADSLVAASEAQVDDTSALQSPQLTSRASLTDLADVPTDTPAPQPVDFQAAIINPATLTSRATLAVDSQTTPISPTLVLPTGATSSTAVDGVLTVNLPTDTPSSAVQTVKAELAALNQPVAITQTAAASTIATLSNGMEIGTTVGNVTAANASTQFTGNGTSVQFDGSGTVQLTADTGNQVGHANLNNVVDLTKNFTLTGAIEVGKSGGADGISLVLVQAPENPSDTHDAQAGGGLGIAGLPNALGFTFDPWGNSGVPTLTNGLYGDPTTPYVGWRTTDSTGLINNYSAIPGSWFTPNTPMVSASSNTWEPMDAKILDTGFHNFTLTYSYDASTGMGTFAMSIPDNGENTQLSKTIKIDPALADYTMSFAASTGGSSNQQGARVTSFEYTKGTSQVTLNIQTPNGTSAPLTVTANIGDTIHIYPDQKSAQAAIDMGMDPATVVVWDNSVGYGLKAPFNYVVKNNLTQTTNVIETASVVSTLIQYVDADGQVILPSRTISGVAGAAIDLSAVEPSAEVTSTINGGQYLLTTSPALNEKFSNNQTLTYTFTSDPTPTVTAAESEVNSYQGLTSTALSNAESALSAASYAASVSPDDSAVAAQYSATQSYYMAVTNQGSAAVSAQVILDSVNAQVANVITTANSANNLATSLEQTYLEELADAAAATAAANSANSLYAFESSTFKLDSNVNYYSQMAASDTAKAASATTAATSATQVYNSALLAAQTAINNAASVANSAAAAAQELTLATSQTAFQTTSTASQAIVVADKATSIAASNVASTAKKVVDSVQSMALSAAMTAIEANLTASQAMSLASADQANNDVQTGATATSTTANAGNVAAQSATNDANQALQYASLAASAASANDVSGAYSYAMQASSLAAQATSEAAVTHSAASIVTSSTKQVASQVTVDSQVSSQLASQAQSVASTAVTNAATASGAADSAVTNANEASATGRTDLANSGVVSAASLAQSAASGAISASSLASYEAKQATSFASASSNYASTASDFASRASLAAASNNASLASEFALSAASAQTAAFSAAMVATSLFGVAQSANNYVQSAVASDSAAASSAATATSLAAKQASQDVITIQSYGDHNTSLSNKAASLAKLDPNNVKIQTQAASATVVISENASLQAVASAQTLSANQLYVAAASAAGLNQAESAQGIY
ncbi:lectin-like domain-containing protein [Furfurilactobacillus curtus]|uniref:KxYKxGKxW signal peptide domain-containing protein n=1 Tax=Furfurilactobacillus curtus TaxID=1746200 RepID=A0ABQ5JRC9_9LACO